MGVSTRPHMGRPESVLELRMLLWLRCSPSWKHLLGVEETTTKHYYYYQKKQ